MRSALAAGTGRRGEHRLASVAALIFLLCAGVNAAPAEKHVFATRLVVTSSAFKSPGPSAAAACVRALKRAVPRGARGGERNSIKVWGAPHGVRGEVGWGVRGLGQFLRERHSPSPTPPWGACIDGAVRHYSSGAHPPGARPMQEETLPWLASQPRTAASRPLSR